MTITYRDWTIEWCPYQGGYEAVSPNYEPVWLGKEDGWLDGDRFTVDTLEQAYAEIDDRIREEAEYQADCAGDAEHERRRHEED
jgi:hypothetical protein